jgi:hypothetical protein
MATMEIDAEHLIGHVEERDGRRILVITNPFNEDDQVVFLLPRASPDGAIRRFGWHLLAHADQQRAAARHDVHRGGKVIAGPGSPS